MPFRHDVRSVTVPGCIDGWVTLHARFGRTPFADLLAPAIALAGSGFRVSPGLAGAVTRLNEAGQSALSALLAARTAGATVTLPGVARTLKGIAESGRAGFYGGEFGTGLIGLGDGLFTADDLAVVQADWVEPLSANAFGVDLHTIPPNSQGYLTLGAALLADQVGLPDDPADPAWAHLLIECGDGGRFRSARRLARVRRRAGVAEHHRGSRGPDRRRPRESPYSAHRRRRHDVPLRGRPRRHGRLTHPVERGRFRFAPRRTQHGDQPSQSWARLLARRWTPGRIRPGSSAAAHLGAGPGYP